METTLILVLVLSVMLMMAMIFLTIWVYRDAKSRNLEAGVWAAVVFLASFPTGLLLYFLVGRKPAKTVCASCGASVILQGKYCPSCGNEIQTNIPVSNGGVGSKKIIGGIIAFFALAIVVMALFFVYAIADGGVHTGGVSIMSVNWNIGNRWRVSFYKSSSTYSKTITIKDGHPSALDIEYEYDSGELYLQIIQGKNEKIIPFENYAGNIIYELSEFENGKVKMYIRHNDATRAKVNITIE